MNNKSVISLKMLIASVIGTALCAFLFKITPISAADGLVSISLGHGIAAFCAIAFGPLCGIITAAGGMAASQFLNGATTINLAPIIASGIAAAFAGMNFFEHHAERGLLKKGDLLNFIINTAIGNGIAWIGVEPITNVIINKTGFDVASLTSNIPVAVANGLTAIVVGAILLYFYAMMNMGIGRKTRVKK